MKDQRVKNIAKYVVPTILNDVCFFLFTIVDGIFVGRSVGTNGLWAINLVAPYILIIGVISMLINIGGVTICAIHIGKGGHKRSKYGIQAGAYCLLRRYICSQCVWCVRD